MTGLSRRRFLQATLATAAAGALSACGAGSGGDAEDLTLWYWGGGLSPNVITDAGKRFAPATLSASEIGDAFKQKLLVTMISGDYVPDITGIKGEDMPALLPDADHFIDLNTLGAKALKPQYLPWKWESGTTRDGRLIGFPIDIGPTGVYYRADLFEQAKLPTDPAGVSRLVSTWDDYFQVGVEIHKALPKTYLVNNIGSVFTVAVGQQEQGFIDENNRFVGDQPHMRDAWNIAVKPVALGIDAMINDTSWNQAIGAGTLATELGAAWHAQDIEQAAPGTKGKWRVAANPGVPTNNGGSFLALPSTCRNPDLAFRMITWMLNPANQARGFTDEQLFPSTPATYTMPALTAPDPFFGGQRTIDIFGASAKRVPTQYTAAASTAVSSPYLTELTNIEANGKNPDAAWNDAVSQARLIAEQQGVS